MGYLRDILLQGSNPDHSCNLQIVEVYCGLQQSKTRVHRMRNHCETRQCPVTEQSLTAQPTRHNCCPEIKCSLYYAHTIKTVIYLVGERMPVGGLLAMQLVWEGLVETCPQTSLMSISSITLIEVKIKYIFQQIMLTLQLSSYCKTPSHNKRCYSLLNKLLL